MAVTGRTRDPKSVLGHGESREGARTLASVELALLAISLVSCESAVQDMKQPTRGGPSALSEPTPAAAVAGPVTRPGAARVPPQDDSKFANAARRCGECHASSYDEWSQSAHARSARSPLYRAMRVDSAAKGCERCHAPLGEELGREHALASEGVTCDACHALAKVTVHGTRAEFELELDDNVKYGPLCDAEPHYFHRVACMPLQSKAELCASCHHLERQLAGGNITIYGSYGEWKQTPYAAKDVQCQYCHMPKFAGEAATGAGVREVSHHRFIHPGEHRQRALGFEAAVHAQGSLLQLQVELINRKAGHSVPGGHPGRQVILRAVVVDEAGAVMAADERVYSRRLVDEAGIEVPFYLATAQAEDNRLVPKQVRRETFTLDASGKGELRIEVHHRHISHAIARGLGIEPSADELVLEARVRIGAADSNRRTGLPARLRGRPPPGDRHERNPEP